MVHKGFMRKLGAIAWKFAHEECNTNLAKTEVRFITVRASDFYVFCLITDKDGNITVVVKFPQCKKFGCLG